ncbi:Rad52/Rad22 family DNA repair protein [Roseisolibacter sp. H3M3-2]|uniref:Rad52/Rad22 family DNA repair protein n=1 Tax=Roseisolibacter sp. H3M3-2 TaxID=3031323 RepID=UPI0023D98D72|nr:Rad52/Rad22 family DNA repair protein [Roseisolibacter sp. H3M3-2]MDF1503889.1 Rad52/Rad22 family DNA repair protein [Roseisolibacter sp. H3M3-2]
MTNETDLARLRDPFAPGDIEWRVQQAGEKNGKPWARVLAYVTNRAIMERLDDTVGPHRWRNEYREGPAGGVICGLSIWVDAEIGWVTKWDGAENSDVEPVKGGLSNAMKRAAVQWGIGRYLYDLEEGWAQVTESGRFSARTKDGKWFKWDPPALPEWATPRPRPATAEQLARIEALLARVADEKVGATVRKRLRGGLTEPAADEALRYLEARAA